ncbi:MAG: S46 family peptidase [Xanthomonadaceae bacterium]|nr:S46 family peptidase [Xanthomonadaceae bacterium]
MKTLILTLLALNLTSSYADEGMWLMNDFPSSKVEKRYGTKIDQKWLDHARLSSVRLAQGCSGSFISPQGLIMTNHHCAHECIEQLSTSGKDFVAQGFQAKTLEDEVKCPELEINQLVKITDVTETMNRATQGLTGKPYSDALKATTAKTEKECATNSETFRCDVVTLFNGGKYNLYEYKRYQDVRLVFAPEFAAAFFGGDPDNFNFPRYDIDLSLIRVYENGAPLKSENYFKWSKSGAKPGEPTFVTGHPGRTARLLTMAQLETRRDLTLMSVIALYSELRGVLTEFSNRGAEQKRIANDHLFGIENSLKAIKGKFQALSDKTFFESKRRDENVLIQKIKSNPKWNKEYGSAWSEIEKAEKEYRNIFTALTWLENNHDFDTKLFGIAKNLVRAAAEFEKPNEQRLKEYTESKIPELKQSLLSTAPIYDELEIAMLTFYFTKFRENLKADHPLVKKIFAKKSPRDLAKSLVNDTELKKIDVREALFKGGLKAIRESKDPFIQFALSMDADSRAIRKKYEDEIESVTKKNAEKIAKARFLALGTDTYPDATFTLRISYGSVEGYKENGKKINPVTTLAGAFERHTGYEPFALPASWLENKSKLNLSTPFNFATSNDIIGGNSGSPVVNSAGEIVGLVFDGNIQSLGGDYGFDPTVNRAVAVHSEGMLEALDKIYGAKRIVNEIK